jgi:hypothetical protein
MPYRKSSPKGSRHGRYNALSPYRSHEQTQVKHRSCVYLSIAVPSLTWLRDAQLTCDGKWEELSLQKGNGPGLSETVNELNSPNGCSTKPRPLFPALKTNKAMDYYTSEGLSLVVRDVPDLKLNLHWSETVCHGSQRESSIILEPLSKDGR